MRFVYATDLHGNRDAIEQLFLLARTEQVDAVVFGGDLTPKSVAIKLAQYHDFLLEEKETGEEIPLVGGEVIPVDMLRRNVSTSTFSESLLKIKLLNKEVGSDVLAEHLERKGSIIIEQTNEYFEFESMLIEQVLLDKLIVFFRDAELPGNCNQLKLSSEEMSMIRDCIVEWMKEFEATLDDRMRASFVKKCLTTFGLKHGNFEQLAPSKYIEGCILVEVSRMKIFETIKKIKTFLDEENYSSEYLLRVFHNIQEQLLRAHSYRELIGKERIAALVRYSTIAQLKRDVEDLSCVKQEQAKFLREYFFPLVREWRAQNDNKPVYVMLGNDDIIENISLLDEAERDGLLCNIHNTVHKFGGGFSIAGYGFVENLQRTTSYSEWLKSESGILSDLRSLHSQIGRDHAMWVIHAPPLGYFDQLEEGGSEGSRSVLQFLTESQPSIALLGHIHEAPRLTGNYMIQLGKTICVNPGGEHNENLQAVLINTDNLKIERRIVPYGI